jgi:hypothetical protein
VAQVRVGRSIWYTRRPSRCARGEERSLDCARDDRQKSRPVKLVGLLGCHAPPRRTQQKSTAPPAAHPLGKHANLGPPSSPTVNDCRPSAMLNRASPSVRSRAKCATCAICARSPRGRASLTPRHSGHASLPRDTAHQQATRAPTPSRRQPSVSTSSRPSLHFRHERSLLKISFSPYTFPPRRIRRRSDSTSHSAPLSSQSPRPTKELRPWPFSTSG